MGERTCTYVLGFSGVSELSDSCSASLGPMVHCWFFVALGSGDCVRDRADPERVAGIIGREPVDFEWHFEPIGFRSPKARNLFADRVAGTKGVDLIYDNVISRRHLRTDNVSHLRPVGWCLLRRPPQQLWTLSELWSGRAIDQHPRRNFMRDESGQSSGLLIAAGGCALGLRPAIVLELEGGELPGLTVRLSLRPALAPSQIRTLIDSALPWI